MPAISWLILILSAALIAIGCIKGWDIWAAFKQKAKERAEFELALAELERVLASANCLIIAQQSVSATNSMGELYFPEIRTLH